MLKNLINQREMHRSFLNFYNTNKTKLDAVPIIAEIILSLLQLFHQFDELWEVIEQNPSGTTLSKRKIRERSAEFLNKINLLFYNYCLKNNQLDKIANFKGSVSAYLALPDEQLISRMDYTCNYADSLGESLADTAVTAEELEDLKTLRDSYIAVAPLPKEIKRTIKIANAEIKTVAAKILQMIKNRLDSVMEAIYEGTDDEFYQSYLEATNIEKVGHKKVAVKGSILDKLSKQAVPQAHILIPEAGIDHLCGGKNGGFRITHLNPGTYQIEIQAVTYKTIQMELIHRYGETNLLEIEMESEEAVNN